MSHGKMLRTKFALHGAAPRQSLLKQFWLSHHHA